MKIKPKNILIDLAIERQTFFFGPWISIAIQRGNAASILGTFSVDINAGEFYDVL